MAREVRRGRRQAGNAQSQGRETTKQDQDVKRSKRKPNSAERVDGTSRKQQRKSGNSSIARKSRNAAVMSPYKRGMKEDEDGARYEGRFKDGMLEGRGTIYFPDGGWQQGIWRDGQMEGEGEYVDDEGYRIHGCWKDGLLNGPGQEVAPGGFLVYQGEFKDGVRNGMGTLNFLDGGRVYGSWVNGELHGQAEYWYPDGKSGLNGVWKHGDMKEAKYFGKTPDSPPLHWPEKDWRSLIYCCDESTQESISSSPLLPDPYEAERCRVGTSSLCGTKDEGVAGGNEAGEGLFLRTSAQEGELLSFYNGIRYPHAVVDKRAWKMNGNCISLDEEFAIDVPPEHSSIDRYCASLGHKANHSFQPNAEYAPCFHPRFGHIKCIRALRRMEAGEEVLVHYGYTNQMPRWYLQIKRAHEVIR
ncbi:hypothetical protein GUITHDRAFT_99101 [Guillardia theta CCMP2712]|uniref:Histone-lysine N-methyltransferase SETD7 n=1 Tax=Guillardia theta (strain CCMP2712) TaxID=905079 RepID=L1K3F3_GUITC|nr:hypothetical protein GUITHDRAFT_99101 [Guillardia theta CCMP2712]EKX55321.1 hypothetical protein GUITHDRAFT_99101 [Guillardia theta CCMP2712]|eukprot:XP_005842301.1 hypothetical protein GUITHDRAFT_99101 [Guillardia theta CCMP2712]